MKRLGLYIVVVCALLIALIPIYWIIISAFKERSEIFAIPPTFWPEDSTLDNFRSTFGSRGFGTLTLNSLLVASAGTAISVLAGTTTAYALSRHKFPWKLGQKLTFAMLATRMVPPIVVIVPGYAFLSGLNLINTYIGLIAIYGIFNVPLTTWLMYGFFRDLPYEIEEAGLVDGDHHLGVMIRIILPLVGSGLVATTIFTLILTWNEFMFALTLMSTSDRMTLPVGTASLVTQFEIIWGELLAASVVAMVPILIFTIFAQKYLIRGMTMGAVKG